MKKSEFELWRNGSETKEVLQIVSDELKTYAKALIEGAYANEPTMEKVAGKYIYSSAYVAGLRFILEDIVNHLEEDEEDEM